MISTEIKKLILNGFLCRCPKCGQGRVLDGYLTKADKCNECNESFTDFNADDGPAWFVMIFVGILLVPVLIIIGINDWFPMWGNILVIIISTISFTLLLLPPVKSMFIAVLWHINQEKDEQEK